MKRKPIVFFLLVMVLIAATSCTSSGSRDASAGPATSANPQPVKPIDGLRADLVAVGAQLTTTLDSADAAIAANAPPDAVARLQANLGQTESIIRDLRATLEQLDRRADEYLATWSGKVTVTITEAGVYKAPAEEPKRAKAKYDQMLDALRRARDQVNPALTEMQQLHAALAGSGAALDAAALRERAARARQHGTRGAEHLEEAVRRLDELKSLLPSRSSTSGVQRRFEDRAP